jgi:hypothetical protein
MIGEHGGYSQGADAVERRSVGEPSVLLVCLRGIFRGQAVTN